MPPKRSKSQEREKKRKYRLKMSEKKAELERSKAKEGMQKFRATEEDGFVEYDRLKNKLRMRKVRSNLSAEEADSQKNDNLQGMKMFRKEGRLRKFKGRTKRNLDELTSWREFQEKNESNSRVLEVLKPDIVQRINEKTRIEEEERREKTRIEEEESRELFQSRRSKCLAGLKAYDMKVVSAVDIDDTRKKKLVDFHEREKNLNEQERSDFTKLRQAIYSEYRKTYKIKFEGKSSN